LDIKKEQASKEVIAATAIAAAAAATPVPFSDAFTLVPIQVAMIAKISYTFGMDVSKVALTTMVTSLIGAGGAVFVGRTIVTGLLKMIRCREPCWRGNICNNGKCNHKSSRRYIRSGSIQACN
jgi:uncharacterized protein (DUF697 family)